MKSRSFKLIVLTFLVGMFSLSIAAQDQSEAETVVQSATTKKQVKALVASAKTPADHMKLAGYFNQEAERMEADAKGHEELAAVYRLYPSTAGGGKAGGNPQSRTAKHCDAAAKSLREAAKSLREMATDHEQMAKEVSR